MDPIPTLVLYPPLPNTHPRRLSSNHSQVRLKSEVRICQRRNRWFFSMGFRTLVFGHRTDFLLFLDLITISLSACGVPFRVWRASIFVSFSIVFIFLVSIFVLHLCSCLCFFLTCVHHCVFLLFIILCALLVFTVVSANLVTIVSHFNWVYFYYLGLSLMQHYASSPALCQLANIVPTLCFEKFSFRIASRMTQ